MTVAAKETPGFGSPSGARMRNGPNPWRRLWQVPLLLAGLALFGLGVRAFIQTIKPVAFEQQVIGVRSLLQAENYDQAISEINRLGEYYHDPRQRASLQLLSGDAHYLIQRGKAPVRTNYERVLSHYEKSIELGITPDAAMNERWGIAALVLGQPALAVEKLEAAIAQNPALLRSHARELVNAYAGNHQLEKAQAILHRLLAGFPSETPDDQEHPAGNAHAEEVDNRVWALCKQIELAIASSSGERGGTALAGSIAGAREALKSIPEAEPGGRVLTWLGRGELQRGNVDQANEDLLAARGRFISHNIDDGRAAILLARISEARGNLAMAAKLYEEVAEAHSGTPVWAAARLGRADVQARLALAAARPDEAIREQDLADFHYVIAAVRSAPTDLEHPIELVSGETVSATLLTDYERAISEQDYGSALIYLALQQELNEGRPQSEAMSYRLATTRERRAEDLFTEASRLTGQPRLEKEAEARAMVAAAAADYQHHARLATLQDDLSGDSLWKAAQLFDKAGEPMKSVALYEQFTRERPRDSRIPEAILAAGRLYQSAGMFDKAIAAYQKNLTDKNNSHTPAAYTSAVNLARCYMALADAAIDRAPATAPATGPATQPLADTPAKKEYFERAEATLLALVQDSTDLRPEANEFRISLCTLGELYYRNARWADAILRLEEACQRYPQDPGIPRALFMLAESYRSSSNDIAAAIQKDPALAGRDILETARADRLAQAAVIFSRVIGLLDPQADAATSASITLSPLEAAYVRRSYMNRAQCYFDRGDYAAAIKLYDEAATRFSEEPLAVRACVQIVNAYLALKEPTQAEAAAKRGRWILKRIPDDAFTADGGAPPAGGARSSAAARAYYDRLLTLADN